MWGRKKKWPFFRPSTDAMIRLEKSMLFCMVFFKILLRWLSECLALLSIFRRYSRFFYSGLHVSRSWQPCRSHEYLELLRHQINFHTIFPRPKSHIKLRFYPLWTFTKERFWFFHFSKRFRDMCNLKMTHHSVLYVDCNCLLKKNECPAICDHDSTTIRNNHVSFCFMTIELLPFGSWQLYTFQISSFLPKPVFWFVLHNVSGMFDALSRASRRTVCLYRKLSQWLRANLLVFECTASLHDASHVCKVPIRFVWIVIFTCRKFFQCRPERCHFVYVNHRFFFWGQSIHASMGPTNHASIGTSPSSSVAALPSLFPVRNPRQRNFDWDAISQTIRSDGILFCWRQSSLSLTSFAFLMFWPFDPIPWPAPGSYSSLLSTEGDSAICAMSYIFLCRTLCVSCVSHGPFEVMKNVARELDVVEFNTEWWTRKCVLCDDHLSEDVRAGESWSYVILDQVRWTSLRARGSHTVVTLFQMLKMGPAWFVLIPNVYPNTFHVSNVSREKIQLNSDK